MSTRKRLLNRREDRTRGLLEKAAARNGARVFSKIRVADVLEINGSGISDELFRYALSSHFDFVVADRAHNPLFAVEFDGPLHSSDKRVGERDGKKNAICQILGFPLARVRDEHIFERARGLDYLTWLVELFFANQDIHAAYEAGDVPLDEYLDTFMFVTHPTIAGPFPLWLSMQERVHLQGLEKAGAIVMSVPTHFCGQRRSGVASALTILTISPGLFLISEAQIYVVGFGVDPSDAADEIATVNLGHDVRQFLQGAPAAVRSVQVRRSLVNFLRTHHCDSQGGLLGHDLGFTLERRVEKGVDEWHVGALEEEPAVVIPSLR